MADSAVDDDLWEVFHEAVNMTSRELAILAKRRADVTPETPT
jgi:hypothetical protein